MIRTFTIGILASVLVPALFACGKLPEPAVPDSPREERNEDKDKENNEPAEPGETETTMPETIQITVSGKTLPVKIEDNAATKALVAILREASVTYEAHDYGGFEKVGPLGRTLPAADTEITTRAGDVILYGSDQVVLFYGSNSWSYTRLGRIQYESLDELKSFLKAGQGNISVTLSL